MNSPFANIFIALQQQLQTQVPAIVYIDQDLGQLRNDRTNTRPPVQWPCLLIDFEDFTFENMGNLVQSAEGTIVLRLGFAPYSSSTATTPTAVVERAINYYDIEWALHNTLQGWAPGDNYGRLTRIVAGTQKRWDTICVRELRYRIAFQDYDTKPMQQTVAASVVIDVAINEEITIS